MEENSQKMTSRHGRLVELRYLECRNVASLNAHG